MSSQNDVIFECVRDKGIITLNRPHALNALNVQMINEITAVLKEWERSKLLILIEARGEKSFSVGGDLRFVMEAGTRGNQMPQELFRDTYALNALIGNYRIPYISFIDGIVMGGGVGLSVHGHYRVATERTVLAMPEAAVGLIPDVGTTYILPRLSGKLGCYLALTGHRLKGLDVLKAGIATHFCSSKDLPALKTALMECNTDQDIRETLQKFSMNSDAEFSLNPYVGKINQYFSAPTVEDIMRSLQRDSSSWAEETLYLLAKMSPISLKIAKKALNLGAGMNLLDCLQMEYRIAVRCLCHTNFYEGVRAVLIDKDHNPSWSPKTLEEVTDKMVEDYFVKLPDEEELNL